MDEAKAWLASGTAGHQGQGAGKAPSGITGDGEIRSEYTVDLRSVEVIVVVCTSGRWYCVDFHDDVDAWMPP